MSDPLIECVPNFSEGTDRTKVLALLDAMHVPGVSLLDWSMDADHNRSVITVAGPPEAVIESAVRAAGRAAELIDLTQQSGVHPRIGSADVIPFVPIANVSLDQCAIFARRAGGEIWRRFSVPVYFYEAAAARPDRARLEDVRQGQFEGLRQAARRDPARRPDVGGPELHATAGASAVGARKFLIAWNVFLDRPDVGLARALAKDIRDSGGGLQGVKALGALVRGRAQISMNITDFRVSSPAAVYARLVQAAALRGARLVDGELIGLLPEAAFERDAPWVRQLEGFTPEAKILERRLEDPLPWP
jgi:glutamate formiminotransferase / 5-formyltetrahydrofolate cyclo-ligase